MHPVSSVEETANDLMVQVLTERTAADPVITVTASRRQLTFDCRGLRFCVSVEDARSLSRRRGGAVLSWGVGRSPPRPTVSVLAVNDGTPPPDREPRSVISALTDDRSMAMSALGRVVVVVSCPPYGSDLA